MHDDPTIILSPCANPALAWAAAVFPVLKLIALAAPLAFFCHRAARRLVPDQPARFAAALISAVAAVSALFWLLPLNYPWLLAAGLLLAVGAWFIKSVPDQPDPPPSPLLAAGLAAVVIAAAAVALIFPYFPHDPLTYQLYQPAQWIAHGRITIVPTPFGDPSHAYGPQLASTLDAWLMIALGNDLLAQTSGLIFLVLAMAALIALARELGAPPRLATAAGLLLLVSAPVMLQAMTALNDLAISAGAAAAVLFLLRAARRAAAADLFLGLTAIGLTAGFKYTGAPVALLLTPLLIPAASKVKGRPAALAWVAGLAAAAATGGVWYLRTWIITGNPVFPLEINLWGHQLFAGLYGSPQMRHWLYHTEGAAAWLKIIAAGPGLLVLLWPPALVFVVRNALRENKSEGKIFTAVLAYTALLPLVMDRVMWRGLPFQVDRFWLAPTLILLAVVAALISRRVWALAAGAALAWAGSFLPGVLDNIPEPTAWIARLAPALFGLGLAAGWGLQAIPADTSKVRRLAVSALVLALIVALVPALRQYPQRRAHSLAQWSNGPAWAALPCPDRPLTIAYTGANTPYPLLGFNLQNRVFTVSTAGAVMPLDHQLRDQLSPPRPNTPEPMIASLQLCPQKWARALLDAHVDLLFVMRVPTAVLINVPHTAQGFPIEDQWAGKMPGFLKLIRQDDTTRIYRLQPRFADEIANLDSQCRTRPIDAIAACQGSALQRSPDCEAYFPLGIPAIKSINLKIAPQP